MMRSLMTHETNCSHHWIYIFPCLPHTLFSTSWAFAYRQSAAWRDRPNFYRNDTRPMLPTSGRTEDLKETRKRSVTYQHKGEKRISSPVLWLWTKFHLPLKPGISMLLSPLLPCCLQHFLFLTSKPPGYRMHFHIHMHADCPLPTC